MLEIRPLMLAILKHGRNVDVTIYLATLFKSKILRFGLYLRCTRVSIVICKGRTLHQAQCCAYVPLPLSSPLHPNFYHLYAYTSSLIDVVGIVPFLHLQIYHRLFSTCCNFQAEENSKMKVLTPTVVSSRGNCGLDRFSLLCILGREEGLFFTSLHLEVLKL